MSLGATGRGAGRWRPSTPRSPARYRGMGPLVGSGGGGRPRAGSRWLVERVQIGHEAPDGREPERPPAAARSWRKAGPGERVLDRHPVLAGCLEERQVLSEELLGALELEPERATDPQIVSRVLLERGHAAPPLGQGRASSRRRSRSTFA